LTRGFRTVAASAVVASAVGCLEPTSSNCTDTGAVDVVVLGTDLSDYNNRRVHARLVEEDRDGWIAESEQVEVLDGSFEVYWSCGAESDKAYIIHVWIDVDTDLVCEVPDDEPGWVLAVSPSITDLEFDVTKEGSVRDSVCEPFG
jgi:hypothetical protein